jgi:hypothetical protein
VRQRFRHCRSRNSYRLHCPTALLYTILNVTKKNTPKQKFMPEVKIIKNIASTLYVEAAYQSQSRAKFS